MPNEIKQIFELSSYQLTTQGYPDYPLGKVFTPDAPEAYDKISFVPLRHYINRALWSGPQGQQQTVECSSNDGVTGSEYGQCDSCALLVACSASYLFLGYITKLGGKAPKGGAFLGLVRVNIRPPRRFSDRPKNWDLVRTVIDAEIKSQEDGEKTEVSLDVIRQSNRTGSMYWSEWDKVTSSRVTIKPVGVTVGGEEY